MTQEEQDTTLIYGSINQTQLQSNQQSYINIKPRQGSAELGPRNRNPNTALKNIKGLYNLLLYNLGKNSSQCFTNPSIQRRHEMRN